jgi:S-formylglutathione hydrolase FrmB
LAEKEEGAVNSLFPAHAGKQEGAVKMSKLRWIGLVLLALLPLGEVHAQGWRKDVNDVGLMNKKLYGTVIDFTDNHGTDNRIWSPALFQRRDLYVYLPPAFDPHQHYPLMIWLHGFCADEKSFLHHVVPLIDEAIKTGKLPPLIVAAPDGTLSGEPHPCKMGSFFLNSDAGDFADFVLYDVFDFVCAHYPIRTEREAHVLAGCSMGGFAAFNLGIKHREAFGTVIGICPPLNLRWQNSVGNYFSKFDPRSWGWRSEIGSGLSPIARFLDAGKRVNIGDWFEPLFGPGNAALNSIAAENPIEMVDAYQLRPRELDMYIGYSKDDEFNIDAQVESFLYLATWRGLSYSVGSVTEGRHCIHTFVKLIPAALDWLNPRLAPFSPLMASAGGACGPAPCDVCANTAVNPCAGVCANPPGTGCGMACPNAACAAPKYRPLLGNRSPCPACPSCEDLSSHLPPLFLPDRLPEDETKKQ